VGDKYNISSAKATGRLVVVAPGHKARPCDTKVCQQVGFVNNAHLLLELCYALLQREDVLGTQGPQLPCYLHKTMHMHNTSICSLVWSATQGSRAAKVPYENLIFVAAKDMCKTPGRVQDASSVAEDAGSSNASSITASHPPAVAATPLLSLPQPP
jgi:hypothetical protein